MYHVAFIPVVDAEPVSKTLRQKSRGTHALILTTDTVSLPGSLILKFAATTAA
jgi:hypothetical protein